jgi:hypothetical protein
VLDLINSFGFLAMVVADPIFIIKEWRQVPAGNVRVFIDGCTQYRPTIFSVPGWVVSSPSEKGNSIGCSAKNHPMLS